MQKAIDRIELETERLLSSYRSFQVSLTAVYERAVLDPAFPAQRPRLAAQGAIAELARATASRLDVLFAMAAGRMIDLGLADGLAGVERLSNVVERFPEWEDAAREVIAATEADLREQVFADTRRVRVAIAEAVLRRERERAQAGASRLSRTSIDFERLDRAGRRWDSERYVRLRARGALHALYNDSVVHALASRGVRIARFDAPGHRQHDVRFALTANDTLPSYDQVRRDLLHPNSVAVVQMINQR